MALKAFRVHLPKRFCLLSSDLAHLSSPSMLEGLTILVGSQHTKDPYLDKVSRKRLKIALRRLISLAFFYRQTDVVFLSVIVVLRRKASQHEIVFLASS